MLCLLWTMVLALKKKKKPSPFLECLAFQCLSFYLPQVMYLVNESPSTSRETDSEVRNVYAFSGHIHSPFILISFFGSQSFLCVLAQP